MSFRSRLVALALLVLGLTGCTSAPADPAPTTSLRLPPGVSRDQVLPPAGLAKDVQGADPCALITAEQARTLNVDLATAHRVDDIEIGIVGCSWRTTDRGIGIGLSIATTKGMEHLYNSHALTPFKVFQPQPPVDGYPAVRAEQTTVGSTCTIYLGVAERVALWVDTDPRVPGDSCPLTRRVLSAVLTNLPPQR